MRPAFFYLFEARIDVRSRFCSEKAKLKDIYEFRSGSMTESSETLGITASAEAAYATAVESGIAMPDKVAKYWPFKSTTPVDVHAKRVEHCLERSIYLSSSAPSKESALSVPLLAHFDSLSEDVILVSGDGKREIKMSAKKAGLSAYVKTYIISETLDAEASEEEDESPHKILIPATISTKAIECFDAFVRCIEEDVVDNPDAIQEWETAFMKDIDVETAVSLLNGIDALGVKPLLVLLCTKLVNAKMSFKNICEMVGASTVISDGDEAAYETCKASGIPMPFESASKWPLRTIRPVDVYKKMHGTKRGT
eukprot:g1408.t1